MAGSLIILTGASGSGKTTLAQALAVARPNVQVICFDSIGVPDAEAMAALGAEQWQRATTLEWMRKLAPILASGNKVLFEGQMRIAFIHEAIATLEIADGHIVLVDCDDAARMYRLTHDRRQPELADQNMMHWARYLREEAARTGCDILDTGKLTVAESVELLSRYLG